jgi:hypothetical protein
MNATKLQCRCAFHESGHKLAAVRLGISFVRVPARREDHGKRDANPGNCHLELLLEG